MIDTDNEFTKEELERKAAWLRRTHADAITDSKKDYPAYACGCTDCTGNRRAVKGESK